MNELIKHRLPVCSVSRSPPLRDFRVEKVVCANFHLKLPNRTESMSREIHRDGALLTAPRRRWLARQDRLSRVFLLRVRNPRRGNRGVGRNPRREEVYASHSTPGSERQILFDRSCPQARWVPATSARRPWGAARSDTRSVPSVTCCTTYRIAEAGTRLAQGLARPWKTARRYAPDVQQSGQKALFVSLELAHSLQSVTFGLAKTRAFRSNFSEPNRGAFSFSAIPDPRLTSPPLPPFSLSFLSIAVQQSVSLHRRPAGVPRGPVADSTKNR